MALSPEDVDFIEKLKEEYNIDRRLGRNLGSISRTSGVQARVREISDDEGENISKNTFNPTIRRIIEQMG